MFDVKLAGGVFVSALAVSAGALAKEFPPRAPMICGATQCRTVNDPVQSRAFSSLLWGESRVTRAPTPRVGSPSFHDLNCGRFQRGRW
jgi:hypothetical protein